MMNPVFYLYLKLYKAGQLLGTDRLIYSVLFLSHHTRDVILSPSLSLFTASL